MPFFQKNRLLQFALIAFGALLLCGPALSAELIEHATYITTTAEDITIEWDAVAGANQYQWQLVNVERSMTPFATGKTTLTKVTVKMPKTGHWIFRCRSINAHGESDWAESIDSNRAQVAGQPRAWWIFSWVEKPSGAGF